MNDMHVSGNVPALNDIGFDRKPFYLSYKIEQRIKNHILKGILIKRDPEASSITYYNGNSVDSSEESSDSLLPSKIEHKFTPVQSALRGCDTLDDVLNYIRSLGQNNDASPNTPQKEAWHYFIEMTKSMGIKVYTDLIPYLDTLPYYMQSDFLAVLNRTCQTEVVEHQGHHYKHEHNRGCNIL